MILIQDGYMIDPKSGKEGNFDILIDGDKIEKLNTKTDQTISPLVYPSWHPSGKYVAFLSLIHI